MHYYFIPPPGHRLSPQPSPLSPQPQRGRAQPQRLRRRVRTRQENDECTLVFAAPAAPTAAAVADVDAAADADAAAAVGGSQINSPVITSLMRLRSRCGKFEDPNRFRTFSWQFFCPRSELTMSLNVLSMTKDIDRLLTAKRYAA